MKKENAKQPKLHIIQNGVGEWFVHLKAKNGRIIWHTETYQRKKFACNAIEITYPDGIPYETVEHPYSGPEKSRVHKTANR